MNLNRLWKIALSVPVTLSLTVFSLLFAVSALGAEAEAEAENGEVTAEGAMSAITNFESMNLKIIYIQGIWVGLLSGELSEFTAFPAHVEVGVPEDTMVGWFGQMPSSEFFDDATQFPEPYEMRTEDGMDIYFAIMTNHYMQMETRIEENPLIEGTIDEFGNASETLTMRISYTPLSDLDEMVLTAAFPPGFVSTEPDLRFFGDGPNGEQTFGRPFENVSAGEEISTTITATFVGEGAAEPAADNTTIFIVLAITVVLVVGVFFFFIWGKRKHT